MKAPQNLTAVVLIGCVLDVAVAAIPVWLTPTYPTVATVLSKVSTAACVLISHATSNH